MLVKTSAKFTNTFNKTKLKTHEKCIKNKFLLKRQKLQHYFLFTANSLLQPLKNPLKTEFSVLDIFPSLLSQKKLSTPSVHFTHPFIFYGFICCCLAQLQVFRSHLMQTPQPVYLEMVSSNQLCMKFASPYSRVALEASRSDE